MEDHRKANPAWWKEKIFRYEQPRFHDCFFDTIALKVKEQVREWGEKLRDDNPRGILLFGDVGTGKTAIMVILQRYLMFLHECRLSDRHMKYENRRMYTHSRLIAEMREDRHNQTGSSNNGIERTDFLFIDDLGVSFEDSAGWNFTLLQELIDYRWSNSMPTFFTTNIREKELLQKPGWSRIADRLLDLDWLVQIETGSETRRRHE